MPEGKEQHQLTYSAPRVLFERMRRHRTGANAAGIVFSTVCGAFLLLFPGRTIPDREIRWIAMGIGIAFLLGGLFGACQWLWGRDRVIRITENGIEEGHKMWPWSRIEHFGGWFVRDLVAIRFGGAQNSLGLRPYGGLLQPTPLLTVEEFRSLATRIQREICPGYPRLVVSMRIEPDAG